MSIPQHYKLLMPAPLEFFEKYRELSVPKKELVENQVYLYFYKDTRNNKCCECYIDKYIDIFTSNYAKTWFCLNLV